jgi:P pilus assembly chaperone PapD
LLFFILVWSSGPALANLSINKLWVDFAEGQNERGDLVIRNDSEDRYYVSVSVTEIANPGTPEEEKITQIDPEKSGLLVTPNRMVLEPGAIRSIRLVSLNENLTEDRIYRVLVAPQVGRIKAEQSGEDARGIALKLLAAYDVLVVVRPSENNARIEAVRSAERVTLKNTGNSNILLTEGFICPPDAVEDPSTERCKTFESQRLYAGNIFEIDLPSPTDMVVLKTRDGPAGEFIEQKY